MTSITSLSMFAGHSGMSSVESVASGSDPDSLGAGPNSQPTNKAAQTSAQGDTAKFSDAAKQLAAGNDATQKSVAGASTVSEYGTVSADQGSVYLKPGQSAIVEKPLKPGTTELLGTATTKSGRLVSVSQFVAGPEGQQSPQAGYMVSISGDANHEAQSFQVTGDAIINEDKNGELQISAYTAGKETDGNDIIIGAGHASLNGGKGDDTIFDVSPNSSKSISGGDGNDTIIVAANSVGDTIDAGNGDDKLIVKGGILGGEINMGEGNDSIQARNIGTISGQTTIDTGNGNDSVSADFIGANGSQVNIKTGDGNDKVHAAFIGLGGDDQVNIDTGDGNDLVDASWIGLGFGGSASQVNINTGKGNDAVRSSWIGTSIGSGSTQVNIDTGEGNDTINSSWIGTSMEGGSSQVNIKTGDGNDNITSSWIGSSFFHGKSQVNIDTGKGDDKINASSIGFSLDENANSRGMLSVVQSASGDAFVAAGTSGDDMLYAKSGRLHVWTNPKTNNGK